MIYFNILFVLILLMINFIYEIILKYSEIKKFHVADIYLHLCC